jgi:hypothetical protein
MIIERVISNNIIDISKSSKKKKDYQKYFTSSKDFLNLKCFFFLNKIRFIDKHFLRRVI